MDASERFALEKELETLRDKAVLQWSQLVRHSQDDTNYTRAKQNLHDTQKDIALRKKLLRDSGITVEDKREDGTDSLSPAENVITPQTGASPQLAQPKVAADEVIDTVVRSRPMAEINNRPAQDAQNSAEATPSFWAGLKQYMLSTVIVIAALLAAIFTDVSDAHRVVIVSGILLVAVALFLLQHMLHPTRRSGPLLLLFALLPIGVGYGYWALPVLFERPQNAPPTTTLPLIAQIEAGAWQAYQREDYDTALQLTNIVLERYASDALKIQTGLSATNPSRPDLSTMTVAQKQELLNANRVLNSVASCYIIRARVQVDGKKDNAAGIKEYQEVLRFPNAIAFNAEKNEFWSQIEDAERQINLLQSTR